MNDLDFLESYLEEPEATTQNASGPLGDFFDKPLTDTGNAVQVNPGEKVAETVNKEKNKSSRSLFKTASSAKKKTEKVLGNAVPDLDDLPKPPSGGIGLLVFISLLVVFAISPAGKSGATRLQLIWGSMLGNNTLPNDTPPPAGIGATAPGIGAVVPNMNQLIQGGLYT